MPLAWQITIEVLWTIMVDWLNNNPGVVNALVAIGTISLAVVTFIMAKASRRMAEGMERQGLAMLRPEIIITVPRKPGGQDGLEDLPQIVRVALENVGRGPAMHGKVWFEARGFRSSGDYPQLPIPSPLRPGQRYKGLLPLAGLPDLRSLVGMGPALVCVYQDLLGNPYVSRLEIEIEIASYDNTTRAKAGRHSFEPRKDSK